MKGTGFFSAVCISACLLFASSSLAAFDESVEKAYNTAVAAQDALDGLDVKVMEQTVSSKTNMRSEKQVDLQVSGIKNQSLSADITVTTDETSAQSYYRNGYYYEWVGEEPVKTAMDRETIWKQINSNIYLDMTSNYLKMLYAQPGDEGTTVYYFSATEQTLGDYKEKLLDAYSEAHGITIDSLHGTMVADAAGHVLERSMELIYTVGEEKSGETFMKQADAVFAQEGTVTVTLPDLTAFTKTEEETPAVVITPREGTVYATADVNVRTLGSLDAAVIGGFLRGDGMTRTGETSDGWVQVLYGGETGYVWGEYVSAQKPVTTKAQSGTMYATADVNVRSTYSTEGTILGVLKKGAGVEITGNTDNGWTRVKYQGQTGYVSANYLSWSEPATEQYIRSGNVQGIVTDASYGSLTIRRTSDGGSVMFNTKYAAMYLADTICEGDLVVVGYTGASSPYTATSVTDKVTHGVQEKSLYTMDGVVSAYKGGVLTLSCSDGVVRTFDLSGASVEGGKSALTSGAYVMVTWESVDGSERKNIPAVAVG